MDRIERDKMMGIEVAAVEAIERAMGTMPVPKIFTAYTDAQFTDEGERCLFIHVRFDHQAAENTSKADQLWNIWMNHVLDARFSEGWADLMWRMINEDQAGMMEVDYEVGEFVGHFITDTTIVFVFAIGSI